MTEPVRVKAVMDDAQRRPALTAEIARYWDELAELLEAGTISDKQFAALMRSEPDEDAPTLLLTVWRGTLRRALAEPRNIGIDWEALNPTAVCRCDGSGMVYDPEPKHPGYRPCDRCQPKAYRWWNDHVRDPEHRCDECTGGRRRRQSPTGEREDRAEDSEALLTERQQRELQGLA